jgi:hypothetical protein
MAQTPTAIPFTPHPEVPPARDIVYVAPEPVKSQHPAPLAREPVLPVRARQDDDNPFAVAVEAAGARLSDTARCPTALEPIEVARVDTPSLQRGDLKLALIAGGQGALVLSADRATIVSVASAAIGMETTADAEPGSVSLDAVEAVLRATMRAFADKLPGIAGTPARFVRLADTALPARSPHFKIVAPLRIGERTATLRWLVPTWMAGVSGDARTPTDVP